MCKVVAVRAFHKLQCMKVMRRAGCCVLQQSQRVQNQLQYQARRESGRPGVKPECRNNSRGLKPVDYGSLRAETMVWVGHRVQYQAVVHGFRRGSPSSARGDRPGDAAERGSAHGVLASQIRLEVADCSALRLKVTKVTVRPGTRDAPDTARY